MVKLSDFVGELIKGLASARTYADYGAAATSEVYSADPFIKNLPVPHYVIDEAEIEVPVMVIGVSTQSEDYDSKKQLFNDVLAAQLPATLLETYKWNFINGRIARQEKQSGATKDPTDYKNYEFPARTIDEFNTNIAEVTGAVTKRFAANLELYNYAVLKLLELTETLGKELKYALNRAVKKFKSKSEINPFLTKEAVTNAIDYVSNIMFFHFMKIMQSDSSVQVDVNTSRMEEYAQRDCLMHIKIKVREQDLNLVVEEEENGRKKRYLSLS